MSKSFRFGSALSAIAAASMIGGCAAPQTGTRSVSAFGKMSKSDIGLATRALVAIQAGEYATAVSLAERAVEKDPKEVTFRTLLGNAYFASGRFASAEAAYKDSLALFGNQPQVILRLALVDIAQGRNAEAVSLLTAGRSLLDPSDRGLALALAGQAQAAVELLDEAARQPGADSRVRQNLALAHALAGDWTAARTIAAQDLSADLVDARVREWMEMAKPSRRASDQIAALVGVTPAAADPGQPVRLALHRTDTRMASAAPAAEVPAPVQAPVQPAPVVAQAAPAPVVAQTIPAPIVSAPPPLQFASVEPLVPAQPEPAFAPADPEPAYVEVKPRPRKVAPVRSASVTMKLPPARLASLPVRAGRSTAVVQLGAYGSSKRVAAAWDQVARRHAVLRPYVPVSARFQSTKGLVYRLSVKGFESPREAVSLCASLRRQGTNCFVRSVAGDAPVNIASR